jgi:hypothetical protein
MVPDVRKRADAEPGSGSASARGGSARRVTGEA